MHDIPVVLVHSIFTVVRLIKLGGLRAVVAESALARYQLLIAEDLTTKFRGAGHVPKRRSKLTFKMRPRTCAST